MGKTHPICWSDEMIDGLTSFFRYDRVMQKAIKTLKYRLVTDLTSELVSLLPIMDFHNFVLVPIPLHPSRLRSRGFNQAEVLGRLISQKMNILIEPNLLKRMRNTPAQAEVKTRDERLKNIGNAFSINQQIRQSLKKVILFDDVFTTGATMRAAASVLKKSGVKYVWGMTIAR